MAWSAIVMLFVQPLKVDASNCGCVGKEVRTPVSLTCSYCSAQAPAKSCCDTQTRSCCSSSKKTCCSSGDQVHSTPCRCGDQCQCSVEKQRQPHPFVPLSDAQTEQTQTVAVAIYVAPLVALRPRQDFGCPPFSVHQPTLTAQQICALLSRFIV